MVIHVGKAQCFFFFFFYFSPKMNFAAVAWTNGCKDRPRSYNIEFIQNYPHIVMLFNIQYNTFSR